MTSAVEEPKDKMTKTSARQAARRQARKRRARSTGSETTERIEQSAAPGATDSAEKAKPKSRGKRRTKKAARGEQTTKTASRRAAKQETHPRVKHEVHDLHDEIGAAEAEGFAGLGLDAPLLRALARAGFEHPTDIQREMIPVALAGEDCLGQARTGTGKTAAFTLPMLQTIERGEGLQGLVLVPTRELAAQVGEHVKQLSPRPTPRTVITFGGTRINRDLKALEKGIDILVGTPGRVLDLIGRGAIDLSGVKVAVLDEVDRMLDIGFRDDIRRIMSKVAKERQTIFVSATITDEIRRLAKGLMRSPAQINVSQDNVTVDKIRQDYLSVRSDTRFDALKAFLEAVDPTLAIVFTRTKRGADLVSKKLRRAHIACVEIHGGLAQGKRTRVLDAVREGKVEVLVATDLASRGLDVTGVSHVVNYDIPDDPAVYVHRIGRTARMGAHGHALTLVLPDQGRELTAIEMLINQELTQVRLEDFA